MGNGSPQQDGGLFIYPKRFSGINKFQRPYFDGDKVRIEVHSINQLCYFWFSLVANENRNSGLFATPPVNIPNYCFYSVSFTDPSNPFNFKKRVISWMKMTPSNFNTISKSLVL